MNRKLNNNNGLNDLKTKHQAVTSIRSQCQKSASDDSGEVNENIVFRDKFRSKIATKQQPSKGYHQC